MASLGSATLDCFRTGSVVQLKSKVNNKTLAVRGGGTVYANGAVGYYVGRLAPRSRVWGRWTNGNYYSGTVTNVDSKVHVKFDDGDQISHDINDATAVLPDSNPDPEVLQKGTRVIASFSNRAQYYVGRITEVNKSDPKNPSCHILFDDGDKQWNNPSRIRIIPDAIICSTGNSVTPIVQHSRILGRWTNNQYYRGHVANVGHKIDVQFDDGDRISHDHSDVSAVFYDVNPQLGDIQVSSRVVAFWPKSNHFYLGHVTQIDYMYPHQPRYFVEFDDGDTIWSTLNEIRRLPLSCTQAGCIVWGRWTNQLYYHGQVTSVSDGKIHVQFDDGDRISHSITDTNAVLEDIISNPYHVHVGSRVIAAFGNRPHYYQGRVAQVDWMNPQAPRFFINYDDGDEGWVNCHQLRILSQRTDEVGTPVWGRWTNGLYYHGRVETVDSMIHIKFDDGDRISHNVDDKSSVILDVQPTPNSVEKGSRVIAAWPNRARYYPGVVSAVDTTNPYSVQFKVNYDDGDRGYVTVDKLRILPSPGPAQEAQFTATHIGGNVVALSCVAHPEYYLGVDGGMIRGKSLDNYCHFYAHETPDKYVTLESCMLPGQHIGVNPNGTIAPPGSTHKTDMAYFEVKLLFSPYGQNYVADHYHTGGHLAGHSTVYPGYPGSGQPPAGHYPPPPGHYPLPGQYPPLPAGYPVGTHPPPPGPPGHYPPPPGHYPPPGGYPVGSPPPPPGGYPYGQAPPPYQ